MNSTNVAYVIPFLRERNHAAGATETPRNSGARISLKYKTNISIITLHKLRKVTILNTSHD